MRFHRLSRSLLVCIMLGSALFLIVSEMLVTPQVSHAATRNLYQWPYAVNSIWNMPLGGNARYVDATISSRGFGTDIDWFITTKESDPLVPMYMPPTFGVGRCAGTTPQQQAQWHPEAAKPIHVPADLVIGDAINSGGIYSTPNATSAFLQPDGKTLINFNVTARCQAGGPLYGVWFGQSDITGDGVSGGHGGSAMSSIGGSIRTGELLDDQPLRHALKLDIWGNWMHYDANNGQGHRWPAALADSAAPQNYKGPNPALVMGSLLALPPNVTADSLGISSKIGKKIFAALQNYGGYIVDDTGGDYNALCVEQSADAEFQRVMGHPISQDQGLIADFNKMIATIKVIDNNSPTTIGGGGALRAPLAPEAGALIPEPVPTTVTKPGTAVATVPAGATKTTVKEKPRSESVSVYTGAQAAATRIPVSSTGASAQLLKQSSQRASSGILPWSLFGVPLALLAGGGIWYGLRRRKAPSSLKLSSSANHEVEIGESVPGEPVANDIV